MRIFSLLFFPQLFLISFDVIIRIPCELFL